jgi:16S rRNA (uracil1498-N3)-methyltransferase
MAPEAPIADLPAEERHHLLHVLRLGVGTEVSVFDGRGREWLARVLSADRRRGVTVEIAGTITPAAEPPVRVAIGIGLLKSDRMDAAVRDATMLGAAEIVPFLSDHVAVPARAWRGGTAVERWRRIAVASAKQCGRAVVPDVGSVAPLASLLERPDDGPRLICVEPARPGANPIAAGARERPAAALVLIGPEGGWSDSELSAAIARGLQPVHLGPRTLRAETAPTVLLSALWTVWGWE